MKKLLIKTYRNESLNKAVQEKLFELGYGWGWGGGKSFRNYSSYYIGASSNKNLDISWEELDEKGVQKMMDSGYTLISINELMEMEGERETIKIGDAIYDKEEFENATKHLKKIP